MGPALGAAKIQRGAGMSIFTINRHKRFAVRNNVCLRAGNGESQRGLMVEVSLEACRIGDCGHNSFRIDQAVTVEIEGFGDFAGTVRSVGERYCAIRFVQPIASAALQELVWSASDNARPILHLPAFGIPAV